MNIQITEEQLREQRTLIQADLDKVTDQVTDFAGSAKAEIDAMKVEIAKLNRGGSVIRGHFGPSVIAAALGGDALAALRDKRIREALVPFDASLASILRHRHQRWTVRKHRHGEFYMQPGIVGAPGRPLMLLDLLPSVPISFASAQYNRLTSAFAYAADVQSEQGDTKATQALPTEVVTANIATIASVSAISEQALSDAPVFTATDWRAAELRRDAQTGNADCFRLRRRREHRRLENRRHGVQCVQRSFIHRQGQ